MLFMIISIVIISIVGTLSHFLYDISNHNKIVGLFTAVNESTWEHIKIALTPTIFWSIIDGLIYGSNPNYILAKFISLNVIIFLMPLLFYGYKYLLKKELFYIDIMIFYIVIICSQLIFNHLLNVPPVGFIVDYISIIGLFILFGCYLLLTLLPLKSFLFKDPITSKYGFKGHSEINYKKNK